MHFFWSYMWHHKTLTSLFSGVNDFSHCVKEYPENDLKNGITKKLFDVWKNGFYVLCGQSVLLLLVPKIDHKPTVNGPLAWGYWMAASLRIYTVSL